MVKNSNYFRTFWPTLWKPFGQPVRLNARMCAGLCPTYWTAFGGAEKNESGSCPMHDWDHPPFFEFLTPSHPAPQGPMGTTGGGGMSADIVRTQIIFGVYPCTRCWDIAKKPPKCKKFPIDSHNNENFICLFPLFPPAGGRQPPKGEKTHPEPEYACMRTLAWIGPRVVEKSLTNKQTMRHSKCDWYVRH